MQFSVTAVSKTDMGPSKHRDIERSPYSQWARHQSWDLKARLPIFIVIHQFCNAFHFIRSTYMYIVTGLCKKIVNLPAQSTPRCHRQVVTYLYLTTPPSYWNRCYLPIGSSAHVAPPSWTVPCLSLLPLPLNHVVVLFVSMIFILCEIWLHGVQLD